MKEEEIRPGKIFKEFLSLAEESLETFFVNEPFYFINCPACGKKENIFKFRKSGFDYVECINCGTLYVNPRPSSSTFDNYYKDSPSMQFWATGFYKETEKSRRKLIIRPKAKLVKEYLDQYGDKNCNKPCIIDIGAGYGVFCEELRNLLSEDIEVIAIEPSKPLIDECLKKGLVTIPKFIEEVNINDFKEKQVICAVSFELLEHLHNPEEFIKKSYDLLARDGLLIITTLTWDGFDLQILQENSESIHPPHHINFFTKKSISSLLEMNGFEICDIITPGKLDVDIVAKKIEYVNNPFIRKILESDQSVKDKFQTFLQDAKLSSHMMVIAKK